MQINPPIRYSGPQGTGHIVEIDDDTDDCVLQLESGQRVTIRGDETVSVVERKPDA